MNHFLRDTLLKKFGKRNLLTSFNKFVLIDLVLSQASWVTFEAN